MPRQLRLEYPGAIYHVLNRGDRREPIFLDDQDRERFLTTLAEACRKTDWQIHAYCLMGNHFHLVLETPAANLVAGMRWFLGTYTARFNRRHKLFGHLFSGRYKSLIVDGSGNGYLRTVCDYVHLNPARAKLVPPEQPLSTYPWSSWPAYLQAPAQRPAWLRVDRLLGEYHIPKDSPAGRAELENDLERRRSPADDEVFKGIRRGWCLGPEAFREELLAAGGTRATESHHARTRQETTEEKARRILQEELDKLGWPVAELAAWPKGDVRKIRIACRLRAETAVTLKWVAAQLHMGTWTHVANRLQAAKLSANNKPQNELKLVYGLTPLRHCIICILFVVGILVIAQLACEKRSAKVSRCRSNLIQIRYCKQQWAGNYGKTSNDIPSWNDLRPFFPDEWSNHIPVCPSGGTYVIGSLGQDPNCSIGGKGHSIP